MRSKSARAARTQQQRVARLRATGADQARCGWPLGCTARATDAHESLNRSQGGDPLDPDWLLCRYHHDQVTSAAGPLRVWCLDVGLIRTRPYTNSTGPVTLPSMAQRKPLTIRVSEQADQYVERIVKDTGATRAVVLRAMLSVASAHTDEVRAKVAAITE